MCGCISHTHAEAHKSWTSSMEDKTSPHIMYTLTSHDETLKHADSDTDTDIDRDTDIVVIEIYLSASGSPERSPQILLLLFT